MTNTTTSLPDFETLNINNKTVGFSCLAADVAELIGAIRWDAASVLNWRLRSSAWFAHQILMRMGGEISIELEIRAADFAQALWPEISEDSGRQRIGDLIAKLKEDQQQSGFWMVDINTDRRERRPDGSWFHLPTLYKPAEFPSLLYSVQMAAIECDLCNMTLPKRRKRQREIIESWLLARGCKKIIRVKKEKAPREKSEKEKSARIEELRRQPNEDFDTWLEGVAEEYYRYLVDLGDIGSEYRFRIKRAHHALEMQEVRAQELIVSAKTNGGLRLVGGQPK